MPHSSSGSVARVSGARPPGALPRRPDDRRHHPERSLAGRQVGSVDGSGGVQQATDGGQQPGDHLRKPRHGGTGGGAHPQRSLDLVQIAEHGRGQVDRLGDPVRRGVLQGDLEHDGVVAQLGQLDAGLHDLERTPLARPLQREIPEQDRGSAIPTPEVVGALPDVAQVQAAADVGHR